MTIKYHDILFALEFLTMEYKAEYPTYYHKVIDSLDSEDMGRLLLHSNVLYQPELVCDLLKAGASLKYRAHQGWGPLHRAAYHGHQETAKILIDHGANALQEDFYGRLPIHLALHYHRDRQNLHDVLHVEGINISLHKYLFIWGIDPMYAPSHNSSRPIQYEGIFSAEWHP